MASMQNLGLPQDLPWLVPNRIKHAIGKWNVMWGNSQGYYHLELIFVHFSCNFPSIYLLLYYLGFDMHYHILMFYFELILTFIKDMCMYMYSIGCGSMIGEKLSNKTPTFFDNLIFIIEPYPMWYVFIHNGKSENQFF